MSKDKRKRASENGSRCATHYLMNGTRTSQLSLQAGDVNDVEDCEVKREKNEISSTGVFSARWLSEWQSNSDWRPCHRVQVLLESEAE